MYVRTPIYRMRAREAAAEEEEATRPSLPAGRRALGEHLLTGEESLAQLKRGEGGEGKAANREGGGKCSID